ncbi:MAG: hypothetical protein BWY66_02961 [bacterium ADurb.Bin374]|nr:MAG: hypothetical protein BWY66_02961 [bacterium ADurb.Bin374]
MIPVLAAWAAFRLLRGGLTVYFRKLVDGLGRNAVVAKLGGRLAFSRWCRDLLAGRRPFHSLTIVGLPIARLVPATGFHGWHDLLEQDTQVGFGLAFLLDPPHVAAGRRIFSALDDIERNRSFPAIPKPDQQGARDVVQIHDAALFGADDDLRAHLRELPVERGVILVFMAETAEQTAADAGQLDRIQAQVLVLGHLGRDLGELGHELGAADFLAATAEAAEQFGLVANADLAQFDARAERRGEAFQQIAEIDLDVRLVIQDQPRLVEEILGLEHLHLEFVLLDQLPRAQERLALLFANLAHRHAVILVDDPHDVLHERLRGSFRLGIFGQHGENRADFLTVDGLRDNLLAGGQVELRLEVPVHHGQLAETQRNIPAHAIGPPMSVKTFSSTRAGWTNRLSSSRL